MSDEQPTDGDSEVEQVIEKILTSSAVKEKLEVDENVHPKDEPTNKKEIKPKVEKDNKISIADISIDDKETPITKLPTGKDKKKPKPVRRNSPPFMNDIGERITLLPANIMNIFQDDIDFTPKDKDVKSMGKLWGQVIDYYVADSMKIVIFMLIIGMFAIYAPQFKQMMKQKKLSKNKDKKKAKK